MTIQKPRRRGVPLTVYLSPQQAAELTTVSRRRHVSKVQLVRLALERLFDDMRNGQLELALGIEDR